MASKKPKPAWRNRIVGHADVAPAELQPSPLNWRVHPVSQKDALTGALSSLGWIQHVVVSQRSGTLIDGHLRVALALERNEPTVPVLYVDLSAEEERLALATLDPIGMLAEADRDALGQLLAQVQSDEPALQQMLSDLAEQQGVVDVPPFDPHAEWQGMPEFTQEDKTAFRTLKVHFESQQAVDDFSQLVEQSITDDTKFLYYPKLIHVDLKQLRYEEHEPDIPAVYRFQGALGKSPDEQNT